mmetsp:Transcript_0/g.2  ORF Transcript_0/g.2 Transcript_0/m.2 type:complete len:204 (+) Transcript_0:23-634(+)
MNTHALCPLSNPQYCSSCTHTVRPRRDRSKQTESHGGVPIELGPGHVGGAALLAVDFGQERKLARRCPLRVFTLLKCFRDPPCGHCDVAARLRVDDMEVVLRDVQHVPGLQRSRSELDVGNLWKLLQVDAKGVDGREARGIVIIHVQSLPMLLVHQHKPLLSVHLSQQVVVLVEVQARSFVSGVDPELGRFHVLQLPTPQDRV